MNLKLLHQANKNWDNFIETLEEQEKKEVFKIQESTNFNKLFYYVTSKDYIKFDQTINTLSKQYLYDEEIIPVVYNFYIVRDLHELAYDYLLKAELYIKEDGKEIPIQIQRLLQSCETTHLLSKYKISLERISSLSPYNIPKISPDTINDKRQLNTFILNEIVQAGKILSEKREAIKQITHENRYNDFIQAILRLRLPIWGWSIHDQPRIGTSPGGKDAGNADIILQSVGGINIALLEAFILKDKNYTETHILKCPKYIDSINRYYILVFYLGKISDFKKNWKGYESDVLAIDYPTNFILDTKFGFQDIITEFQDVNNFGIGLTKLNSNIEMYHIMINLGKDT